MEAGAGSPAEARIYRADVVGSMLRPAWLLDARQQFRAGMMEPEVYEEIEDRAVSEAISIQERAGVDVVTDGEMRRDIFFDLFANGMSGFSRAMGHTVRFRGKRPEDAMEVQVPFAITDRIRPRSSPASQGVSRRQEPHRAAAEGNAAEPHADRGVLVARAVRCGVPRSLRPFCRVGGGGARLGTRRGPDAGRRRARGGCGRTAVVGGRVSGRAVACPLLRGGCRRPG